MEHFVQLWARVLGYSEIVPTHHHPLRRWHQFRSLNHHLLCQPHHLRLIPNLRQRHPRPPSSRLYPHLLPCQLLHPSPHLQPRLFLPFRHLPLPLSLCRRCLFRSVRRPRPLQVTHLQPWRLRLVLFRVHLTSRSKVASIIWYAAL